eukprot:664057-Amphidinium_carterae.1
MHTPRDYKDLTSTLSDKGEQLCREGMRLLIPGIVPLFGAFWDLMSCGNLRCKSSDISYLGWCVPHMFVRLDTLSLRNCSFMHPLTGPGHCRSAAPMASEATSRP